MPVCISVSPWSVLTSCSVSCVYILPLCAACEQEYCSNCNNWLSLSHQTHRDHLCESCRGAHISAPPSSPLSSPEPPPPSSPLFDRELHSHLPLAPIERSAAVVLTRIGETQQHAADRLGTTRQSISHWQHHFDDKENVLDENRSGRPRETTEEDDIVVVCASFIDPHHTSRFVSHNETLNGKSSTHILDDNLLPSADFLFTETPRQLWWFLQHNAPTHRANVAQAWLPNQGVNSVEFPPYSPDLNPIENLWQHLEKRAEERASRKQFDLQDVIAEK